MNRKILQRLAAWLVTLFLSVSFVACAQQEEWHPVTAEESERLAVARFNNFDLGTRSFSSSVNVGDADLTLHGWYDFVEHTGYASVSGDDFETQALLWSPEYAALRMQAAESDQFP